MQGKKMFAISFMLLVYTLFISEASYVDHIVKCSLKDEKCLKDSIQKMIHYIGDSGIPELNILPIDPMHIGNVSVTILDAITLTLTEGVIKGFKNCEFTKFRVDIDKKVVTEEISCDIITFKGQFLLEGSSPMLQNVFGNTLLNGNGKAKIKLDKATIHLELPVSVIRKEDGDTYLKVAKKAKYNYDLQKATFDIKNLVIGNNDISQVASSYLNSNWKTVIKSFGKIFVDKGQEYLLSFVQKFYDVVPSKLFVEEDLAQYVN